MIIKSICHRPDFLTQQIAAFKKYAPAAKFLVVIPQNFSGLMEQECAFFNAPYVVAGHFAFFHIVDQLAQAANEPTVIVSWDVIPIKPVDFSARCSFLGKQHPDDIERPDVFHPTVMAFTPGVDTYIKNSLLFRQRPFAGDFCALKETVVSHKTQNLPDCIIAANFTVIGDEYIHHLHGAIPDAERHDCWQQVLAAAGIVAPAMPLPVLQQQQVAAVAPQPEGSENGPGDMLSSLLAKFGITPTPGCECIARAKLMNTNGNDWCEANVPLIVGWLREEAEKRKLPFIDTVGTLLVKRAISRSRSAKQKQAKNAPTATDRTDS